VMAWVFALCLVVMAFLAGLNTFVDASWWDSHIMGGYIFALFPVLLFGLAVLGRFSRRIIWLSVLIIVLYALQFGLIEVSNRLDMPVVGAFHVVNALVLFWATMLAGRKGWYWLRK